MGVRLRGRVEEGVYMPRVRFKGSDVDIKVRNIMDLHRRSNFRRHIFTLTIRSAAKS